MRRRITHRGRWVVLAPAVVLGTLLLAMTACDGEHADDWVVVHANMLEGSSTAGGPVDQCTLQPKTETASLPTCMLIENGKKIGFANYFNDGNGGQPVTLRFNSGAFGVPEITLQYEERKVLEVMQTPSMFFQITIVFGGGHGGPVMIPKSP